MSQIQTTDSGVVKGIKNVLQDALVLAKHPKIHRSDGTYCIYATADPTTTQTLLHMYPNVHVRCYDVEQSIEKTDDRKFADVLTAFLKTQGVNLTSEMAAVLPRKWSLYPPMVLFNVRTFDHPDWESLFGTHLGEQFFLEMLRFPEFRSCTHLAVNKPIIEEDAMRRPFNIKPLFGDFGPRPSASLYSEPSESDLQAAFFCHVTQNGLRQTWAPMYTMFSRGNIKEKKRLLDTYGRLHNSVAVDMYAGIGYFTFSYLKNGATVFAWEINPWSVEGLCRGLTANNFKFKLFRAEDSFCQETYHQLKESGTQAFIFLESNEHATKRLAPIAGTLKISHVNLGLLPTSTPSWPIVQELLERNTGSSTVHVHENVHVNEFDSMKSKVESFFKGSISHLEKVKTFAPDVWHVVMDVQVSHAKNHLEL